MIHSRYKRILDTARDGNVETAKAMVEMEYRRLSPRQVIDIMLAIETAQAEIERERQFPPAVEVSR